MRFDVWIEESDSKILPDLFELQPSQFNKITVENQRKDIANGISLQYRSHYCCDSVDIPSWVIISFEIGKEIAVPIALGIISNYLYDRLKDRKSKIMVNKKEAEIDQKEIERLILTNFDEKNFQTG